MHCRPTPGCVGLMQVIGSMRSLGIDHGIRSRAILHCIILLASLLTTYSISLAIHLTQYERSQAEFLPQAMTMVDGRGVLLHIGNGVYELASPGRAMQYEYQHGMIPVPISSSVRWIEVRDEHGNTLSIEQVVKWPVGSQHGIAEPWSSPYVNTKTMQYWTGDNADSAIIDHKLYALGIRHEESPAPYATSKSRFIDARTGWTAGSRFQVIESHSTHHVKLTVSIRSGWPWHTLSLFRNDAWPINNQQDGNPAARTIIPDSTIRSGIWINSTRDSHPAWHPYTGMPIPIWPIWPSYYLSTFIIYACIYMPYLVVRVLLRRIRHINHLCSACGYKIVGLSACPECGRAVVRTRAQ